MPTGQNFLDNLENLRIVTAVALEHVQDHRDHFAESANGKDVRQAEKCIAQIRVLSIQLEKEFAILEYLFSEGGTLHRQRVRQRLNTAAPEENVD